MKQEKYYITKQDTYFQGDYSKEKLVQLIEKMEAEGWTLRWPIKEDLGLVEVDSNWVRHNEKLPPPHTVASLERNVS